MDAVNDPRVLEIWCQKSAQVGWTETLNNVVGYFADQDPSPVLLVQPSVELGESWSKDRLAPMIRDTPVLRGKIADARSRDSGNTTLHKRFPGGNLTIAGANSPAGLASRPKRVVLFDEVDKYPASAGKSGDPINLGKKRAATFWNRKVLGGSTPTIKGNSRIETAFESSDQRYYYVPCPHCEEFQRLVWAQVRWQDGKPREAGYACKHCGTLIDESYKYEMLLAGEWRATKPFTGIAGFHISELYSVWSTWGEMAIAFIEASKLPETLQTFINESLGETWVDKSATPEAEGLLARRESYSSESLPPEVLLVTMGTDVQDDRLETTIWGWGAEEEAWRIEHIVLRGDPSSSALWAEHDDILRRRFTTDDGRRLVIEACAVDSGGHFTEHVYRYCAKRKRFRVWAIKGKEGVGRLAWPKQASRGKTLRADVWVIGVDTIKDVLYGRLNKVTRPGPGYVHFDASTTQEWLDQLTSEVVTYKPVLGKKKRIFKPKTTEIAQEGLDTTVYAYAAMLGRGGGALLTKRSAVHTSSKQKEGAEQPAAPMVDDVAPAPDAAPASSPEAPPAAPKQQRPKRMRPRGGGFINTWRR
jgi:phage terminase large subunit GpA-like protein